MWRIFRTINTDKVLDNEKGYVERFDFAYKSIRVMRDVNLSTTA